MDKMFEGMLIIKHYGDNEATVSNILDIYGIECGIEYADGFMGHGGGLIGSLYVIFRFKMTDKNYSEFSRRINEMEGSEDFVVFMTGIIGAPVNKVLRK